MPAREFTFIQREVKCSPDMRDAVLSGLQWAASPTGLPGPAGAQAAAVLADAPDGSPAEVHRYLTGARRRSDIPDIADLVRAAAGAAGRHTGRWTERSCKCVKDALDRFTREVDQPLAELGTEGLWAVTATRHPSFPGREMLWQDLKGELTCDILLRKFLGLRAATTKTVEIVIDDRRATGETGQTGRELGLPVLSTVIASAGRGATRTSFTFQRVDAARQQIAEFMRNGCRDPQRAESYAHPEHSGAASLTLDWPQPWVDLVRAATGVRSRPYPDCPLNWTHDLARTVGYGEVTEAMRRVVTGLAPQWNAPFSQLLSAAAGVCAGP